MSILAARLLTTPSRTLSTTVPAQGFIKKIQKKIKERRKPGEVSTEQAGARTQDRGRDLD